MHVRFVLLLSKATMISMIGMGESVVEGRPTAAEDGDDGRPAVEPPGIQDLLTSSRRKHRDAHKDEGDGNDSDVDRDTDEESDGEDKDKKRKTKKRGTKKNKESKDKSSSTTEEVMPKIELSADVVAEELWKNRQKDDDDDKDKDAKKGEKKERHKDKGSEKKTKKTKKEKKREKKEKKEKRDSRRVGEEDSDGDEAEGRDRDKQVRSKSSSLSTPRVRTRQRKAQPPSKPQEAQPQQPSKPQRPEPQQPDNSAITDADRRTDNAIRNLVNTFCATNNLPPLQQNDRALRLCKQHLPTVALEHARRGKLSHDAGGSFSTLRGPANDLVAENLALLQGGPDEVVKAWIKSKDHRANLLLPRNRARFLATCGLEMNDKRTLFVQFFSYD